MALGHALTALRSLSNDLSATEAQTRAMVEIMSNLAREAGIASKVARAERDRAMVQGLVAGASSVAMAGLGGVLGWNIGGRADSALYGAGIGLLAGAGGSFLFISIGQNPKKTNR